VRVVLLQAVVSAASAARTPAHLATRAPTRFGAAIAEPPVCKPWFTLR
jgi:hypothetical protein